MAGFCKDCGIEYDAFDGKMVMLHDELWCSVSCGDIKICLCDSCIENRLGRRLTVRDLIPGVLVNQWYIEKHFCK